MNFRQREMQNELVENFQTSFILFFFVSECGNESETKEKK